MKGTDMQHTEDVSFWPIRGVLLDTGNISATIVANIVTVSIIATPEILHIYISKVNNHMCKHNNWYNRSLSQIEV